MSRPNCGTVEGGVITNNVDQSESGKGVLSIYWAYVPDSEDSEEMGNVFWNSLTSCIEKLKVRNKVFVPSNTNVRVWKEC